MKNLKEKFTRKKWYDAHVTVKIQELIFGTKIQTLDITVDELKNILKDKKKVKVRGAITLTICYPPDVTYKSYHGDIYISTEEVLKVLRKMKDTNSLKDEVLEICSMARMCLIPNEDKTKTLCFVNTIEDEIDTFEKEIKKMSKKELNSTFDTTFFGSYFNVSDGEIIFV